MGQTDVDTSSNFTNFNQVYTNMFGSVAGGQNSAGVDSSRNLPKKGSQPQMNDLHLPVKGDFTSHTKDMRVQVNEVDVKS